MALIDIFVECIRRRGAYYRQDRQINLNPKHTPPFSIFSLSFALISPRRVESNAGTITTVTHSTLTVTVTHTQPCPSVKCMAIIEKWSFSQNILLFPAKSQINSVLLQNGQFP